MPLVGVGRWCAWHSCGVVSGVCGRREILGFHLVCRTYVRYTVGVMATTFMASTGSGASVPDVAGDDLLAGMRERCAVPVELLQQLEWMVGDLETFVEQDLGFGLDEEDAHDLLVREPGAPFANAQDAARALVLVEHARRLANAIAVKVVDQVAESRVVDDHGHASAKAMFGAVTKNSGADLYGLEQVRNMFRRCPELENASAEGDLSWDHLRVLARVYANRRVRELFIAKQGWFLLKADGLHFRRFEQRVQRWEEVNDQDGPEPNTHEKRTASAVQDSISKAWQRRSTQSPLVGAAMAEIEQAYIEAEFLKDWEAAKAIHGDTTCKAHLDRSDAQRRADAQAQIYADAANNPNKSVGFNFVHNIVWTEHAYFEMLRRCQGKAPRVLDADTMRCETIDGVPLDLTEAFNNSLTGAFRRVVISVKGAVIDMSHKRFFTGLARTALQIPHDECEWIGCHVPGSRCQADHVVPKQRGGPTEQINGAILCQRHNRLKERGYTVWRDSATHQLRIKTPSGHEITKPIRA